MVGSPNARLLRSNQCRKRRSNDLLSGRILVEKPSNFCSNIRRPMTNASSLFRSLIIYSVCLPLALVVGYMLAAPTDYSSVVTVGILFGLLTIPLFLRWHYPWMIAGWNMSAILFFLPGRPAVNIPTIGASITISVLQYVLNRRMKFISVPSMTKPLLFITMV